MTPTATRPQSAEMEPGAGFRFRATPLESATASAVGAGPAPWGG